MRCPKCGAKVAKKSKYCPQCGGTMPKLPGQNNENGISGKKNRISIVLFVVAGFLLIVGIVAAVFLWGKGDNIKQYQVETVTIIQDNDWSYLQSTKDNRITLITCVKNEPNYRLCVQGIQI